MTSGLSACVPVGPAMQHDIASSRCKMYCAFRLLAGSSFSIGRMLAPFTLEVIGTTAFGCVYVTSILKAEPQSRTMPAECAASQECPTCGELVRDMTRANVALRKAPIAVHHLALASSAVPIGRRVDLNSHAEGDTRLFREANFVMTPPKNPNNPLRYAPVSI